MKEKAILYKGIEFVNVSNLPVDQQLLLKHAQEPRRIKILIDGKIVSNCIQYSDYSNWYTSVYKQSVAQPEIKRVDQKVFHVVLDKA